MLIIPIALLNSQYLCQGHLPFHLGLGIPDAKVARVPKGFDMSGTGIVREQPVI